MYMRIYTYIYIYIYTYYHTTFIHSAPAATACSAHMLQSLQHAQGHQLQGLSCRTAPIGPCGFLAGKRTGIIDDSNK